MSHMNIESSRPNTVTPMKQSLNIVEKKPEIKKLEKIKKSKKSKKGLSYKKMMKQMLKTTKTSKQKRKERTQYLQSVMGGGQIPKIDKI